MTDKIHADNEPDRPLGLPLNDGLGRAPWADDVEAWLEASSAEEIADDIDRYTMAEVARAVAAERERWRKLVEQCRDALAEELSAWDIDPPLHHVKEAHDACVAWLLRA